MNFIKKHWSNILLLIFLGLMVFPQTRMPVKVFINRVFAFAPGTTSEDDQDVLSDYNWKLRDQAGNQVNFSDFKGKKILINFWATWCPPCVAEMPSMQQLYNDYSDKAVFLFVTNDDHDAVNKFIEKGNYTLPVYQAVSTTPTLLQSRSLPTTFLISEEGNIVIKKIGAADWNADKVRKLLD